MAKGRLKMVDKIRPQKVTIQYARRLRKWECMRHVFCCAYCFVKLGRDIFRKGSDRIIKLCDSDTMKQMKHVLLAVTVITALVMLLFTVFPSSPRMLRDYYGSDFSHEFVRMYENVNLTGAIINPVPSQVKWLEDLSHLGICNKTDPFILAVVFSALTHTKDRKRIRDTWAEPKYYKYTKLRAIFVLGTTENATLQKEVEEEIVLHQDIIQYNFIDSYRNLTYKTLSWMSWVRDYCLDVPWIAKIDDDLVVNPFNLNKYLVNQFKNNPAPREIHGRLRTKGKPWRKGKWNVSKKEYPAHKYPPFVLGPAYIVGRNAIDRIMAYAPYVPLLWLEDVYTTGLVAYAAGIKHVQAEKVLYTKKFTRKLYSGQLAFYIDANEKNKSRAWSYILKYSPAKRKSK